MLRPEDSNCGSRGLRFLGSLSGFRIWLRSSGTPARLVLSWCLPLFNCPDSGVGTVQGGATCDPSPMAPSPARCGTWHLGKTWDRAWEPPANQRGHQRSWRPALPHGPHTEELITASLQFCCCSAWFPLLSYLLRGLSVQQPLSPASALATALCTVWVWEGGGQCRFPGRWLHSGGVCGQSY